MGEAMQLIAANWPILLILVGGLLALFLAGAFGLMAILKKFRVKGITKDGIQMDSDIVRIGAERLMLQNRMLNERTQRMDLLEYRECLARMMSVVDLWVDTWISKLRELQLQQTITKLGDTAGRAHKSVEDFYNLTDTIKKRLTDKFRVWMRENGFDDYSDMEFEHYMMSKANYLCDYVDELIGKGYRDDVVCVSDLLSLQKLHRHEFVQMTRSLFMEVREIKRKVRQEITKLSQEYVYIEQYYSRTGELPQDLQHTGC